MPTKSPVPILTIDGPSGSGKGTVARAVAQRLGWHLLDSGAIYRAVGFVASMEGLNLTDADAVTRAAVATRIRFKDQEDETRVIVNGLDATDELRTETCGAAASAIAAIPSVRAALLDLQHKFHRAPGLVADGRDMGTVVFPEARYKVFLTASAGERARRRHNQLRQKGLQVKLDDLLSEIEARDKRDAERTVAPLRPAADAVLVDSTGMGIEQVVERVLAVVGR